jgi:hypothetical protein
MVNDLLVALEQSGFAATMRGSYFLYPVANVTHVLAALCFFASIAAMDVKVLRSGDVAEARAFIGRVRPWAILFFLLQVASGVMLLAPEASHIFHNPVYQLKLLAIGLGLANVVLLEVLIRGGERMVSGAMRASAAASLFIWLSTAALGRLIAYF